MKRLIEYTVPSGLVIAWRLATCPTSRSPFLVKATTEGVVRPPSALAITLGSPLSITATTLLVVPRSMPMIFAMRFSCQRQTTALSLPLSTIILVDDYQLWAEPLAHMC